MGHYVFLKWEITPNRGLTQLVISGGNLIQLVHHMSQRLELSLIRFVGWMSRNNLSMNDEPRVMCLVSALKRD